MAFKRTSYYLAPQDEAEFSRLLKAHFPQLMFRDDQSWAIGEPVPYRDGIEECGSGCVYIWNPILFPDVPSSEIGGRIQGASTKYVIQFLRSIVHSNGTVRLGQMSASYDPDVSAERSYTEKVFRLLKKLNAHTVRCVDTSSGTVINPKVSGLVVGAGVGRLVVTGHALSTAAGSKLELVS